MKNIAGIDPGANGGVAILGTYIIPSTFSFKCNTDFDVVEFIDRGEVSCCYLENIGGNAGGCKFPSQSMVLGRSWGKAEGWLQAMGIRYELVAPQKWQKALGIRYPKGVSNTQKKNITKAKAQQLFPGIKVTHWNSDALLIAEYGRRKEVENGNI